MHGFTEQIYKAAKKTDGIIIGPNLLTVAVSYNPEGQVCELCRDHEIKNVFHLENRHTGEVLGVGIECITKYYPVSLNSLHCLQLEMIKLKAPLRKKASFQERLALVAEDFAEEISFLKDWIITNPGDSFASSCLKKLQIAGWELSERQLEVVWNWMGQKVLAQKVAAPKVATTPMIFGNVEKAMLKPEPKPGPKPEPAKNSNWITKQSENARKTVDAEMNLLDLQRKRLERILCCNLSDRGEDFMQNLLDWVELKGRLLTEKQEYWLKSYEEAHAVELVMLDTFAEDEVLEPIPEGRTLDNVTRIDFRNRRRM